MFSVSADPRDGFPRDSSLMISLLSVAGFSVLNTVSCYSLIFFQKKAGFSVYLLTSNTESCDEDVEETGEDEVEELVDRPGTTNGT